MSTLASVIIRDVFANRPTATSAGRLFFSLDTGKTYRDNGTSWDDVSDSGLVMSVAGRTGAVVIAESDVTGLVSDLAAKVATTRTISTTAPLTGGGDLSANRTLAIR